MRVLVKMYNFQFHHLNSSNCARVSVLKQSAVTFVQQVLKDNTKCANLKCNLCFYMTEVKQKCLSNMQSQEDV